MLISSLAVADVKMSTQSWLRVYLARLFRRLRALTRRDKRWERTFLEIWDWAFVYLQQVCSFGESFNLCREHDEMMQRSTGPSATSAQAQPQRADEPEHLPPQHPHMHTEATSHALASI
jgi:hypothetical protein